MRVTTRGTQSSSLQPYGASFLSDGVQGLTICWVAVKELKLSYYIGETLLFTIDTHYGHLI